jgi:hypothetical protein
MTGSPTTPAGNASPRTFDSVEDALRNTAAFCRKALWNEADSYVEIWLEKDALAGVVYPVTSMYDVPLMVARGYASLSFLYSAAEAINELDVPAYIYLPRIGFLNGGSQTRVATSLYHLVGAGEQSVRPSACAVIRFTLDRYFARLCSTQDLVNNFGRASCVIRQERTST